MEEVRPDMLVAMYKQQYTDQVERRHYNFAEMDAKARTAYIKEFVLMLEDELHEMLHELPYFKPWKKYATVESTEKACEEFADAIHFFLNIAIGLGMTPERMYEYYMRKNAINGQRLEDTENYKPDVGE